MSSAVDFNVIAYNTQLVRTLHKKSTLKIFKKIGFVTATAVLIYGIATTQIQPVLNATASLPHTLFVFSKRSEPYLKIPSKDRFILFYKPEVGMNVVKQVKGLPGSTLHYDEQGQLWVDDFCVGKPHEMSGVGRSVSALKSGVIPPNHVFAYGSHAQSFDSRYAEFGLIPVGIIKGVGVAVL